MEHRIIGMLTFLDANISILMGSEQTESVRSELLKYSGIAAACHQLVPDSRFLGVIERVNSALYSHKDTVRKPAKGAAKRKWKLFPFLFGKQFAVA